jgi:hypothetical protein
VQNAATTAGLGHQDDTVRGVDRVEIKVLAGAFYVSRSAALFFFERKWRVALRPNAPVQTIAVNMPTSTCPHYPNSCDTSATSAAEYPAFELEFAGRGELPSPMRGRCRARRY